MSNSGAHTEPRTEPFIQSTGADYSKSVNYDQVQVLSYSKYFLLGMNLQTPEDFHSGSLFNQTPYLLGHVSLPNVVFER